MGKPYVPIFFDWIEVTAALNDAERGRLINAIVMCARGEDPADTIKGNERFLYPAFQAEMERRAEISEKRSTAGRAGGEAKAGKTWQNVANESNPKQPEANDATNTKTKTKTKTITNTTEETTRKRFAPPTAEQVRAYCEDKGCRIDPERFVDYYASKGWRVGQTPMKDWQAAVRTWVKRASEGSTSSANPALQFTQRDYGGSDLNALVFGRE